MTDPEIEYRRLVSGDAATVRDRVETLRGASRKLDGARDDIDAAAGIPVWSGAAANAFRARADGLAQGASIASTVVIRARGALETAADAYDICVDHAEHYIHFWRDRPSGLPGVVEEMFALLVNARLVVSAPPTTSSSPASSRSSTVRRSISTSSTRTPGSGSSKDWRRARTGWTATAAVWVR